MFLAINTWAWLIEVRNYPSTMYRQVKRVSLVGYLMWKSRTDKLPLTLHTIDNSASRDALSFRSAINKDSFLFLETKSAGK